MKLFFRRNSRKWRGLDFMTLIPRQACHWEPSTDPDKVTLLQERYSSGLLGRFLQPRIREEKKYIRIPLEERGSFLWREMDGSRTVGELAIAFGHNFPLDSESAPERVATYLYQMAENKLVDFVNLEI